MCSQGRNNEERATLGCLCGTPTICVEEGENLRFLMLRSDKQLWQQKWRRKSIKAIDHLFVLITMYWKRVFSWMKRDYQKILFDSNCSTSQKFQKRRFSIDHFRMLSSLKFWHTLVTLTCKSTVKVRLKIGWIQFDVEVRKVLNFRTFYSAEHAC